MTTTITPTWQTTSGTGAVDGDVGNCLVASIATITGASIDEIPHFVKDYIDGLACDVTTLDDGDWLTVLRHAIYWLEDAGYECTQVSTQSAEGSPVPHLAMVPSKVYTEEFVPHIIVVDQRGVQMWDPQSRNTEAYQPSDVIAMMRVEKKT